MYTCTKYNEEMKTTQKEINVKKDTNERKIKDLTSRLQTYFLIFFLRSKNYELQSLIMFVSALINELCKMFVISYKRKVTSYLAVGYFVK